MATSILDDLKERLPVLAIGETGLRIPSGCFFLPCKLQGWPRRAFRISPFPSLKTKLKQSLMLLINPLSGRGSFGEDFLYGDGESRVSALIIFEKWTETGNFFGSGWLGGAVEKG